MYLQLQIPSELTDIKTFYHWENFPVTNENEKISASAAVAEISKRLKHIEAERKKVTGPIKQGIAYFEEKVRAITQPLQKIDGILRGRIGQYMDSQQKKLEEEARLKREEELRVEKEKADAALALAIETDSEVAASEAVQRQTNVERLEAKPLEVSQTLRTEEFTLAQSRVWRWKIVDESKIPDEYWVLDELELNKLARNYEKLKNTLRIPGIEFEQFSRPIIRS